MKSYTALLPTTVILTAAALAGCQAPDSAQDVEQGDENVAEAKGAVTSGMLASFFSNRQNKPPISYGRGAGTALVGLCPSGKQNESGLCYWPCPSGSTGVGTVCWQGWTPVATRDAGTIPIGYGCTGGQEQQDSLCYTPCEMGYHGVGPVCWIDTIGQQLCQALYDPTIAAWAKYDHRTRTFGLGAGIAAGASVSGEAGVYYGENGEFGCYTSSCYGAVTDVSIDVSASFGDFQSLAALKGDGGFDLSVGAGYGVAGYSQSYAFDANNQVVGFVQEVSLGAGVSPITLGISSCDTSYTDIIGAPQTPPGDTFYIVSGDGQLLRSHVTANGSWDAVNQTIGTGWGGNTVVFAAGGGYVYLITESGDLRYYHHNAAGNWDNWGTTIGQGWNVFSKVFASEFGRIYAVYPNGDMYLYKHDAAGSFQARVSMGVGWNLPYVFSGGSNVVYAVDSSGRLLYYVHDASDQWRVTGQQIGTGWNGFAGLGSMGNGEIYAMTNDGRVLRYQHDPNLNWVTQGQQMGTGFSIYFHGMITAPH